MSCRSNPESLRIRYYTKDFVVLRDNLQQKMRRHTVVPMKRDENEDQDDKDIILDTSEHVRTSVVVVVVAAALTCLVFNVLSDCDSRDVPYTFPSSLVAG